MSVDLLNNRNWLLVSIALLVGSLLAVQGWRSRVPSLDLIPHLEDADALVHHGVIPEKGCLSSFCAYIPPGPTWLFAPGIAADLPARLVKYPATLTLFVLTAIGIFLLGKDSFGASAGVWSMAIYCISERGIFFASSLWPRGHPAFVVWTVLFLCRWASQRQAMWLGAAAATFAVGMYVFMEILPLALAAGFIWLKYRPPIRLGPLLLATLASVIVWAPYLRFESENDWRDLRALLTRKALPLADPKPLLCDPDSSIVDSRGKTLWPPPETTPSESAPISSEWQNRLRHAKVGLIENFTSIESSPIQKWISSDTWKWLLPSAPWLFFLAIGIAVRSFGKRVERLHDVSQGVIWRALLIPWILLLLIPEPDAALGGRRFWWLYPLQVVAVVGVLHQVVRTRWTGAAVSAALLGLAFISGEGLHRLEDWRSNGFSGKDAEAWLIDQRIANDLAGKISATNVGYSIEVWGHAFRFRVIDTRYKVGLEWDWLLRYDFGVANRVKCPEGVSSSAQYEVVEKGLAARFAPRLEDGKVIYDGEKYRLVKRD